MPGWVVNIPLEGWLPAVRFIPSKGMFTTQPGSRADTVDGGPRVNGAWGS